MCFRENGIEVVLFGKCAAGACLEQMQSEETNEPVVAIINLGRISWSAESNHILGNITPYMHSYTNSI